MILSITNKCSMECPHCMLNCVKENSGFMDDKTLENVLNSELFKASKVILVSGGEPTEHPDFFKIIKKLNKHSNDKMITVLSNGLWAHSEVMVEKVLSVLDRYRTTMQITHDERFYHKPIKRVDHKSIVYVDSLILLDPLGRAEELDIKDFPGLRERTAPSCYNLRSVFKSYPNYSFIEAIRTLEGYGKFCTSMISFNGSLSIGECLHGKLSNINISHCLELAKKTLLADLKPCDKCKSYSKMKSDLRIF